MAAANKKQQNKWNFKSWWSLLNFKDDKQEIETTDDHMSYDDTENIIFQNTVNYRNKIINEQNNLNNNADNETSDDDVNSNDDDSYDYNAILYWVMGKPTI